MKERKSYSGILNGVKGVWCDKKPKGLKEAQTNIFYMPDENKVFKKGDEYFDCVVLTETVDINSFEEVDRPKEEENGKEENEVRNI